MNHHRGILDFWLLYASGTIVLIWSLWSAQVAPHSRNHMPGLIQFTFSAVLLVASGVTGLRTLRFSDGMRWPSEVMPVALLALFVEIILSFIGIWDCFTHLHSF